MAALILPSRRVVQPQGPVEVDWANPLAKSLMSAWSGGHVSTRSASLKSAKYGVGTVSKYGIGGKGNGASTSVLLPPDAMAPSGVGVPFGTRFALIRAGAANASRVIFGGGTGKNAWRLGSGGAVEVLSVDTNLLFSASSAVSAGELCALGVTLIGSNGGDPVRVWKNGSLIASGTATNNSGTTSTTPYLGQNGSGSQYFDGEIYLHLAFDRVLSDAEMSALFANPWQLFKPTQRRIWGPVSTGGGTAYSLSADVGSYSLNGQAAAFNYAPGAASYTLTADAGSYSLNGQDAGLSYVPGSGSFTMTAEHGVYSLSGGDASVIAGRKVAGEFGSYGLTGQDAGLVLARRIAGDFGSYSISGQDATLAATGAIAYTLTADSGLYSINGQDAGLTGPQTGGLTTPPAGLIPKIWPMTVRYEGKRRRKHPEEEEKRLQEVAEEAVLQASEEASKRAMRASLEASMKAAQLELAAATMDRLLKLAVKVHEEKMEEEELEIALLLM